MISAVVDYPCQITVGESLLESVLRGYQDTRRLKGEVCVEDCSRKIDCLLILSASDVSLDGPR